MSNSNVCEKKEYMAFPLEMKEIDEKGAFTGYASTFNNMDLGRDIMLPGAFTKTLMESKGVIPILADHDASSQIGWGQEAKEDDIGLLVTGVLNLDIQKGRERHALAKQAKKVGAKMKMSIGYIPKKREFDEDARVRKLIEVDLWEYSFVTFPMNPQASVHDIKTLLGDQAMQFADNPRDLEKLLREAGFSNSEAKAVSSFAIKVRRGDQREVDMSEEMKEMVAACSQLQKIINS